MRRGETKVDRMDNIRIAATLCQACQTETELDFPYDDPTQRSHRVAMLDGSRAALAHGMTDRHGAASRSDV